MKHKTKFRVRNSSFGKWFDLSVPPDCNLVVVCKNTGGGYEPVTVRLTHQVYLKDFSKLPGLSILPVNSDAVININQINSTKREPAPEDQ